MIRCQVFWFLTFFWILHIFTFLSFVLGSKLHSAKNCCYLMLCELWSFPLWHLGTGTIPGSTWASDTIPSNIFSSHPPIHTVTPLNSHTSSSFFMYSLISTQLKLKGDSVLWTCSVFSRFPALSFQLRKATFPVLGPEAVSSGSHRAYLVCCPSSRNHSS